MIMKRHMSGAVQEPFGGVCCWSLAWTVSPSRLMRHSADCIPRAHTVKPQPRFLRSRFLQQFSTISLVFSFTAKYTAKHVTEVLLMIY